LPGTEPIELYCLGGFVLKALYGLQRQTFDLDHIRIRPAEKRGLMQSIAGKDSPLFDKYKLYVELVTVQEVPENFEDRLEPMFPGEFNKLVLMALERHDLVLSKLDRGNPVDWQDVTFLANLGVLQPTVLEHRYDTELRPNLAAPQNRCDSILKAWIDIIRGANRSH